MQRPESASADTPPPPAAGLYWRVSGKYNSTLGAYTNAAGKVLPLHRPDFNGNSTHAYVHWARQTWDPAYNRWGAGWPHSLPWAAAAPRLLL